MTWGQRLGRLWYYRGKGMLYLEAGRQWILPVMGASAASKYLGLSVTKSLAGWIAVAVVAEAVAVLLGWWERRSGATRANYGLATETDPFKTSSLELLAEIRDRLPHRPSSSVNV